jgi:phage gp36-like protein
MDREKLIKQLFVGKVAEIIGTEKTTELLKDATVVIDEMLKSRKADVSGMCEHPFSSVMSKCNGEINHCLKCGKYI